MAAFMQTPHRPVPGAYFATPAESRTRSDLPPRFGPAGANPITRPAPPAPASGLLAPRPDPTMSAIERAAKTVKDTLAQDLKYPELDSYVTQGISSDYDISAGQAWIPFKRAHTWPIPDKIFEQYNQAHLVTMMGLFADLKHAWVSIDNALYMWDYTHPDPPLAGFEEQHNPITSVCMVRPRPGVFIPAITRLLVVATTAEIIILGLSVKDEMNGAKSVEFFKTGMSLPVRGLNVNCLQGSADGRIFFSGTVDNDVYELTYQQEERWFYSRCAKVNHTAARLSMFTPTFTFGLKAAPEHTIQMAVDDNRRLLYTLSSNSTIRVFHMRSGTLLRCAITKSLSQILDNIGHMVSNTDLLTSRTTITSISPISSQEATKLHLVATTSSGCRIFLSATSSYGHMLTEASNAPMSMQVHHVKFPPSTGKGDPNPQTSSAPGAIPTTNTHSNTLLTTRSAARYSPGSFVCLVSKEENPAVDELFISAPDTGRIARPQEPAAAMRFPELGIWLSLNSRAEDIGIVSSAPNPSTRAEGSANEMAVQFDKPRTEIAILTNSGVHCLKRQRLVDIYVNAIRTGRVDDGSESTIKRFIRLYGRTETTATTLAVACGQGFESTSEFRVATIGDGAVAEQARTAFIEYGGKPQINENMMLDQAVPTIDMVRPSPRHDGLALYISRLVRSFWSAKVVQEAADPAANPKATSTVSMNKLRDVQQDMIRLKEFLQENKSFIDGLEGPSANSRASTRQQEVSMQGEHRALTALVKLIENIIEGISFVQRLFSERMDDILASLSDGAKAAVRSLTYESLFAYESGREVAKELVKATVDRSIAAGHNVESIADGLQRQCGSFCSPSDVIIFRAQQKVKKAADPVSAGEMSRNLLNESLKLFRDVASSLSFEQLQAAVDQYIGMKFYGGAIQLALDVAREMDRGGRALIWVQKGRPANDPGAEMFAKRKRCYDLIKEVIDALEQATQNPQDISDGEMTLATKRRKEAYEVIDTSDDEAFQTDLYDWYLERDQRDRLLIIQSPFVVDYLQRRAKESTDLADLLAKYYSQKGRYFDAASVQYEIALSPFRNLSLSDRVEYLSRAKANASLQTYGPGRQNRQKLLRGIDDNLDIASIQIEVLSKLRDDERIAPENLARFVPMLESELQSLTWLYNEIVDQAGYSAIGLHIYQAAGHTNATDIRELWRALIRSAHARAIGDAHGTAPYALVAQEVRDTANRLGAASACFSVPDVLPLLLRYAVTEQRDAAPPHWVVDLFLGVGARPEAVFPVLTRLLAADEEPWAHAAVRFDIARDVLHVIKKWYTEGLRVPGPAFGDESVGPVVLDALDYISQLPNVPADLRDEAVLIRRNVSFKMR